MKPFLFASSLVLLCTLTTAQETPSIQTNHLRLTLNPATGRWELLDKAAGAVWQSGGDRPRFGEIETRDTTGKRATFPLGACSVESSQGVIIATFKPIQQKPEATVRITLKPIDQGRGVSFEYAATDLNIDSIRLLDQISIAADDRGYAITPTRMGLLIPADSGVAFSRRFDTSQYEGCHMNMIGLAKLGQVALITWDDPYTTVEFKSELPKTGPEKQILRASVLLRKSAKSVAFRVGGKGDWNDIGRIYRDIADAKGLRVTMEQKIKAHPDRAKLRGASNIKLWSCLSRTMNEESTKEEKVVVNWTFDEAAQVAEHIKNDLKIDKSLFTLGGWIHRGYDNQHPDVLPAAPELGGDAQFAQASQRIMKLGYLLCLHDNYQDMYRDAPSWDEKWLQRNPDGSITKGGKWAGGRAYFTCAKLAVDLAKRPQNLPAVRKLTGANSYFIDTTYAVGPQECFAKDHPLTRADDIHWKCVLSDYAREVFGVFGSECGREWAIPHADFFEGMTGVSGRHFHDAGLVKSVGGVVVPIFEMVYRDCIALYGKYGYSIYDAAPYVLHHLSIGRPLHYHSMDRHLYWKDPEVTKDITHATPSVREFKQTGPRKFAITFGWQVEQTPQRDWRVFVHFTDSKDAIRFQSDYDPSPSSLQWQPSALTHGPFNVTVPAGLSGTFDLQIGLHQKGGDRRGALTCGTDKLRRVLLGKVKVEGDKIEFTPAPPRRGEGGPESLYVRADGGWAQGMHPMDRFLKNTHEILSPLNEITSKALLRRFEFVTPDRSVHRSIFGDGMSAVTVTVNYGPQPYTCTTQTAGKATLPAMGFVVESPSFIAFCATAWNGLTYDTPTLFTLRALDNQPLAQSARLRIFHGFGDSRLRLGTKELAVEREVPR